MAITDNEIRAKEFPIVKNGYDRDEVGDFLDELADQTQELGETNMNLLKEIESLKAELAALKKDKAEAEEKAQQVVNAPAVKEDGAVTFNEPSYFKNLETTLRETLISAQRIADETIDEARNKARKIVSDAQEQAAGLEAASQQKLAEIRQDYEQLKNAGEEYHKNFSALVDEQAKLLKDSPLYSHE